MHLDPLAIAARLLERGSADEPGRDRGIFMCYVGFALGVLDSIWASAGKGTVRDPCAISVSSHRERARRVQQLALGQISTLRPSKVKSPAQRAIFAPRLVATGMAAHFLIDNPIERSASHRPYRRKVSGLRSKHSSVRSIIVFAAPTSA